MVNVWSFNNDELFDLVKHGDKTATCWLYENGESLPKVGDVEKIVSSTGNEIIITVVDVFVCRFCDVDETWVRKEGEGDKSLEYWRRVHREFFTRECESTGIRFSPDMKIVCMEFKMLS